VRKCKIGLLDKMEIKKMYKNKNLMMIFHKNQKILKIHKIK